MKKLNLILGTVCFIALSIVCTYVVSCSSKEEPFNSSEEKIVIKTITSVDELNDELLAFLDSLNQPQSRGYTPDVNFKDDSCVEISDGGSGVSAQIMLFPESTTKAIATYTKESSAERKTLIAEDMGNNVFTYYNTNNTPLFDFTYDPIKKSFLCTKVHSQISANDVICNVGMTLLGMEIASALAIPTYGLSLVFSALWAVETLVYCSHV